jgi:hypothetical protein
MPKRLDLGPGQALWHDGDPRRLAVLLPGQFYPTRAPALWFAREVAMARGWSALEVLGEPGLHPDPLAWERECAEGALARATGQAVVIGKSLASLLADLVNRRELPAVWLTPVLTEPSVPRALTEARRPALLAGGTADPLWDRDAIPDNENLEVLEFDGVDHALQVPGHPADSLRVLRRMSDAVGQFLSATEAS